MCMNKNIKDITGQTFNRLTAIEFVECRNGYACWRFQCSCGNQKILPGYSVRNGSVKSCGCLHHDRDFAKLKLKGDRNERGLPILYSIYTNMKYRCNNPNIPEYSNYGGRGIKVCDEWSHDYDAFYDWAMSNGYSKDLTLDRINNDGDYSPSNCRWATKIVQQNNTRANIFLEYDGKRLTLAQWARELGVNYQMLRYRYRAGWDTERILTTASQRSHSKL